MREKQIIESNSPEETLELGRQIGAAAQAGDTYALIGDLGVGKTAFAEGFALGLGLDEPVASPTFTILMEYDAGRLPFYHFDVYRIGDSSELDEIGFYECVGGDGVSLIEWADLIEEVLPEDTITITIEKDLEKGFEYRRITIA